MTEDISEWADMMQDVVSVEVYLGRDKYGTAFYGSTRSYQARVNYKNNLIRTATGEQVVSRGYAIMACSDPVEPKDRITLPDHTTPLILAVNQTNDERPIDPLYTRIDFA